MKNLFKSNYVNYTVVVLVGFLLLILTKYLNSSLKDLFGFIPALVGICLFICGVVYTAIKLESIRKQLLKDSEQSELENNIREEKLSKFYLNKFNPYMNLNNRQD